MAPETTFLHLVTVLHGYELIVDIRCFTKEEFTAHTLPSGPYRVPSIAIPRTGPSRLCSAITDAI